MFSINLLLKSKLYRCMCKDFDLLPCSELFFMSTVIPHILLYFCSPSSKHSWLGQKLKLIRTETSLPYPVGHELSPHLFHNYMRLKRILFFTTLYFCRVGLTAPVKVFLKRISLVPSLFPMSLNLFNMLQDDSKRTLRCYNTLPFANTGTLQKSFFSMDNHTSYQ